MYRNYGTIEIATAKLQAAENSARAAVERVVQRGGDLENLQESTARLQAESDTFVTMVEATTDSRQRRMRVIIVAFVLFLLAFFLYFLNSRPPAM